MNSKNNILDYDIAIPNNNLIKVSLNKYLVFNVDSYHPTLENNCNIISNNVNLLKH